MHGVLSVSEGLSNSVKWGPGYIGLTIAVFLYGVEICQFAFYVHAFPRDSIINKLQVYAVGVLDTAHFFALLAGFYRVLITCRRNISQACTRYVPGGEIFSIGVVPVITFIVQIFYAHRVWIVSDRNVVVTSAVVASTCVQLVLGLMVVAEIVRTPTMVTLYSIKFVAWAAIASAVCDAIITFSVVYYLRPSSIRKESYIKRLVVVFVQMGLFTFINALAMVIMYYIEDRQLGRILTTAPGVILSTSYVNSMLGVLNARKTIRDEQENARRCPVELPTISALR